MTHQFQTGLASLWTHLVPAPTLRGGHHLAFEGKVYQQIHGTVIGSPLLVVVANLVMEDVEQEVLSTFIHLHGFEGDTWMICAQHFPQTWQTLFTNT